MKFHSIDLYLMDSIESGESGESIYWLNFQLSDFIESFFLFLP